MIAVEYRDVPTLRDLQAATDGNLRRRVHGDVWLSLKQHKTTSGYMVVNVGRNGAGTGGKQWPVHRLILLAFSGPPPSARHHAAHLNGLRFDNRAENLAWKTPVANEADKIRHGSAVFGERSPAAKLTAAHVQTVRALIRAGVALTDIAARFNVTRTAIYHIKTGRNWQRA